MAQGALIGQSSLAICLGWALAPACSPPPAAPPPLIVEAPPVPSATRVVATASKPIGSPFRVVARGKHKLIVATLGKKTMAVLGNALADITANTITLRPESMKGLEGHFGLGFNITMLAGRWPDAAFVEANDTLNGDLFRWRADRWEPLHPKRLENASGGYYDSWQVAPWSGGRILTLFRLFTWQELEILHGPAAKLPRLTSTMSANAQCNFVRQVDAASWSQNGELILLGPSCKADDSESPSLVHWSATSTKMLPIAGLAEGDRISASFVRTSTQDLYLVGARQPQGQKPSAAYLARWDANAWKVEQTPATQGSVIGFAPGDGKLYLADSRRLWARASEGNWQAIPLPSLESKDADARLRIDGGWVVEGATWLSGSIGRPGGHSENVILHTGQASLPDDDAIEAALKPVLPQPR